MKWKFETRKLSEIKPWSKNPRKLSEKGLNDLNKSIIKFGLPEPLVLNTDGTIIGGHARYKVLKQSGETNCFCAIPSKTLTGKELSELNIRLNKNITGEFDFDILEKEFEIGDLKDWGFDEAAFDDLIKKEKLEEPEEKELVAYKRIHVLISFEPKQYEKIKKALAQIQETDDIEYEQSAN